VLLKRTALDRPIPTSRYATAYRVAEVLGAGASAATVEPENSGTLLTVRPKSVVTYKPLPAPCPGEVRR
jgi:hypothetical protein